MHIDFNFDDMPEDAQGSRPAAPPPPPDPGPQRQAPALEPTPKRLRLPLIGDQPVSMQMQVLAAVFLLLLALAAYVAVMDGRATTNRAIHIAAVGEVSALTERIARIAPLAAGGSVSARQELKAVRDREAMLLLALGSGGQFDGRRMPAVDESLEPALNAALANWIPLDKAAQALLRAQASPPEGGQSADGMQVLDESYVKMREAVAVLARSVVDVPGGRALSRGLIAGLGSMAMLLLVLFFRIFNDDAVARRALLARQRREAEEANAATQAAVAQLRDEFRHLAEGDLTARATPGHDITGAIAEAMNYALGELSVLVRRINDAARRVATATGVAARTSEELLAASESQSQEIRRASGQVLSMAQSMTEVSGRAEQSAGVARQSLDAAGKGSAAVTDAIIGMDGIRGQIQETSKRIKRLGESSQEIGEIVELISDITEQTNVLALNAAIQAASAGEAGRGFTVVAEEVQRLAERSAGATRRIAVLVKTIQADTQGAVAAMESSTQGVIEGTRLSDAAGQALADISTVSRQLAELIEGISADTRQQAEVATRVAQAMREILRITEQTGAGTRSTAISISELADLAVELKGSVAGFKV